MKTTQDNHEPGAKASRTKISEEERTQVRSLTNARIQHACSFAALVIILIDLAAFVIGQDDWFFTTIGIMIAIALLAIGMLNNPTESKAKNAMVAPEKDAAPAPEKDATTPATNTTVASTPDTTPTPVNDDPA